MMANERENSPNDPHFFRVILPHNLQHGTLELPVNFMKKHGKSLRKYGHLKLPTGAEYKIEVKKNNDRAWLHKGWPNFVQKNSIQKWYFLVFRYEGGSRFGVRIFDMTTTEIDYPPLMITAKPNYDKLIHLKQEAPNQIGKEDSSFTVVMRTTHVEYNYTLHIPDVHSRRYIRNQNLKEAFLLRGVDRETTWAVKIYAGEDKKGTRFSSGWKAFVVDNNLQIGDSCEFELISHMPNYYRVTISRDTHESP